MTRTHPRLRRLSHDELIDGLIAADVSTAEFIRITGANPRTVERWLAGDEDIPAWVGPMVALLRIKGIPDLALLAAKELEEQ